MNPVSQAIVLLLATNVAHAADRAEPPKAAASAAAQQAPAPMRSDRLDPAVIERAAAGHTAPKAPVFPAEQH